MAEAQRPTDDEIIRMHALEGARGVFRQGREFGIDQMRAENAGVHEFEESLAEMAQSMGFTGHGLGYRRAILDVFDFAARRRTNEPRKVTASEKAFWDSIDAGEHILPPRPCRSCGGAWEHDPRCEHR